MPAIDLFNGDADGICALHQLRLAHPRPHARLITGVKRDIRLLSRIRDVTDCELTVIDVSLDRNRDDLLALLAQGNQVLYIDHHFCGDIPDSPLLTAHIEPEPTVCSSVIVDRLVDGRYRGWAVVGAFGDNLNETARELAGQMQLKEHEVDTLRECGILLNYNGYGARLQDLYFAPDELYRTISHYADPLVFYRECSCINVLRQGFADDMNRARSFSPERQDRGGRVFVLPGKAWARRAAGVFANEIAREKPDLAHALLIANEDGTFRVSVRAPLNRRQGADQLCRRYPDGGGRAAAAGINQLDAAAKDQFIDDFFRQFTPDDTSHE